MITLSSPTGGVVGIGNGHVRGWAIDPANSAEKLRVIVLLDGDIAAFGNADMVQPEAPSQTGNGAHGFVCDMPRAKLEAAGLLTVLAETRSGLALVAERSLKPRREASDASRAPAVHFDITDLLEFLFHHREVSGIQRVQCGYLVNILASPEDCFPVRICAQVNGLHRYVEIARGALLSILHSIESRRELLDGAWREYIDNLRRGTGAAPDFRPGDVILTTGGPWVYDQYFRAIEAAKRDHGVFYFQISYDIIPLMVPETASYDIIGVFNRSVAGMIDCADHILAISRHSELDFRTACTRIGAPSPPISTIPLGATLDYRQDTRWPTPPAEDGQPSPREIYGEYVLCVGTIEPRKNHIYLYDIWKRMQAERGSAVPKLVCVGRMGWHMEQFKRRLDASGYLDGAFVQLSGISDDALKRLYRDCLFTVFPSFYEGWGLPVAESLLFGKLCVSSNTTSMPEVGGDWVVYVDPHNLDNGYRTITGLLDDRSLIVAHEERLKDNYRPLTWRDASAELTGVVEAAMAALPKRSAEAAQTLPPLACDRLYTFTTTTQPDGALHGLAAELQARETAHLLAGQDWYPPEGWGTWSCGQSARLAFGVLASTSNDLVCYLLMRLPHYAADTGCRLLVDGCDAGAVMLNGQQDQEVRLMLQPGPRRMVEIELRLARLLRPPPELSDQRLLGIGLRTLYMCAAADRKSRLAYFGLRVMTPQASRVDLLQSLGRFIGA